MAERIYQKLRVLDLSTNIAGPLAAMTLGDLGADVIKIERPPAGDDTRSLPPYHESGSTIFSAYNKNKRSLILDIKSLEGMKTLKDLIAKADILIESFPPGLAEKYGLHYDDIQKINRSTIVCSISAFGERNLGSKMPGYDALVQAVSGMMSFTGHPDSDPVRIAPSILDISTGMWGAMNCMAALEERRQNEGRGKHLIIALIDSAFAMMSHQVIALLTTGQNPEKLGSGTPSATPYRVYTSADNEAFILATASDAQFIRLCEAMGQPSLAKDTRFLDMKSRITHRAELDGILEAFFSSKNIDDCLKLLEENGISCGRVNTLSDAMNSAVFKERDLIIQPSDMCWENGMPLIKTPINVNFERRNSPPPRLGEDEEKILQVFEVKNETIKSNET